MDAQTGWRPAGQDSDFHLRQKFFSLCSCNHTWAISFSAARILAQMTARAKGLAFAVAGR